MTKLMDYIESTDGEHAADIREMRLGKEPIMAVLFTQEVEEINLHYESDETIRSYIQCPGDHCPLCFIGSAPTVFLLLPVYSIDSSSVEVLRIPNRRGPDTLLGGIYPFLKDPDIAEKLLMISRKNIRYNISSRPLGEKADRGVIEIEAFKKLYEGGLDIRSAFPRYTPSELAEVERIRKKLDALGGYVLPDDSDEHPEDAAPDE